MVTGNWVLQNLTALPPSVAEPLLRFPGLFLYGCLSADIFIGKGCVAKEGHSHNWESALALLERANTMERRAWAYGYLSHLAADTVAHNVFVPHFMAAAPALVCVRSKMAHVYVEMQADRMLFWDKNDALASFRQRGSRDVSRMLWKTLRKNPLKFRLQSGVYQGSIAVGGSALWRRSLKAVDGLLPNPVNVDVLQSMLVTATRAVVDVLGRGEASPVFGMDPIGETALARAGLVTTGPAGAGASMGFSPAGKAARLNVPLVLPDALQSLPAVCSAQPKVAA